MAGPVTTCGCLCATAGHHDVCQGLASPGRHHLVPGLAFGPNADVCRACFDAVMPLVRRRLPAGNRFVRSS